MQGAVRTQCLSLFVINIIENKRGVGIRVRKEIILSALFSSLLLATFYSIFIPCVSASMKTWYVPTDFPTIQDAIDNPNVLDGDTIFVYTGTYGGISVWKALTLIGEDKSTTIIAGSVTVNIDNVNISGFTIQDGSGIILEGRCNCTIGNNIISDNYNGITIFESYSNNISGNKIANNPQIGIFLGKSSGNIFRDNNMIGNGENFVVYARGDVLSDFINDIDTSNTVNGKSIYYLINQNNLTVDPSTFPNMGFLAVVNSTNVTVKNLTFSDEYHGVIFAFVEDSSIFNSKFLNNTMGICLFGSNKNDISQNRIFESKIHISSDIDAMGIHLYGSNENSVFQNEIRIGRTDFWRWHREYGIHLKDSDNNIIHDNVISGDDYDRGIVFSDASNITIEGNSITSLGAWGVGYGVYGDGYGIIIKGNIITNTVDFGISGGTVVEENILTNSSLVAGYGTIRSNSFERCKINCGVGNLFIANTFIDCSVHSTEGNNALYYNNFISTDIIAGSHYNAWDSGCEGNYWSDYLDVDADGDGIGDRVYAINEDNRDNYPLMGPVCVFDVGAWNETTYYVHTISNSTVSDFNFSSEEKQLSFNVTGADGAIGFCRVGIPRELLWCDNPEQWKVMVNNTSIEDRRIIEDTNYTYLCFTYNHTTIKVQIQGTYVIPEFSSDIILPLFTIITSIAIILEKSKRKHQKIRKLCACM